MHTCAGYDHQRRETKLLAVGEQLRSEQPPFTLKGQALEEVDSFSYLGSEVGQDGKVEKEGAVRLEKAGMVYQTWRRKVFKSHNLSKDTKLCAFRTLKDACLTVLCGNMECVKSGSEEAKDVPNEMSL